MAPRQSKSQPATSSSSVLVAAAQQVGPQNSLVCDQLFCDFHYCYQKLLAIKDEIVRESESKALKDLYSQLGNLLVLFLICTDFADYIG
jgi:hypothetical protein